MDDELDSSKQNSSSSEMLLSEGRQEASVTAIACLRSAKLRDRSG